MNKSELIEHIAKQADIILQLLDKKVAGVAIVPTTVPATRPSRAAAAEGRRLLRMDRCCLRPREEWRATTRIHPCDGQDQDLRPSESWVAGWCRRRRPPTGRIARR